MKVVIQIPCKDEAEQLPATLAALPRELPGIEQVQWLVIDDGSLDDTVAIAVMHGVDIIVRLPVNVGLARAFTAGLEAACRHGADIIVNVDADNQYDARDIPALVAGVIAEHADIVVGCRSIDDIPHFSILKKYLQRLGSCVVRLASGVQVADATSGFRAYSREAAMRINVYSRYTYTLETLIQAGQIGLRVLCKPVRVNPPTRPSRLMKSMSSYVHRSMLTIVRSFLTYRPMHFFMVPAAVCIGFGTLIGLAFLRQYLLGEITGHVQALLLAAILITIGSVCIAIALLANQLAVNRRLLEDMQFNVRRVEWKPQA